MRMSKIISVLLLVLLCGTASAQESALGIDLLGGFGRGFQDGERISFNGSIRPVYDVGAKIADFGMMFADGPSSPAEWSVFFDRNIATVKFGEDTSYVNLSVKVATVLNEGTELTNNWYAATFTYKPNLVKGGVWSHLSLVAEPVVRTVAGKPDYFEFRSGVRVTF